MKKILYTLAFVVSVIASFQACSTDPVALDLQPAYKYTDAYYEQLRAYKASDHSICYVWFADYGSPTSMAYRFGGLPDSVDVISLWGGIPEQGTLDWEEMKEHQELKGTKLVSVTIIRITSETYKVTAGYNAQIPSYMEAYNATYKTVYDECIANGDDATTADATATASAHTAGRSALSAEMDAYPTRTLKEGTDSTYEYPSWCVAYGDYLLKDVFDNGLNGLDLDYEPEGDHLSGTCMLTFIQYLSQFVGPKSSDPENTLLVVDGNKPPSGSEELVNYWVHQNYGSTIGDGNFKHDPWKNSQLIFTENIGDYWATGGKMEQQAAFQPSTGGRKGGFGAFHCQRDYNTTDSGADKALPYGHLRRAIQLQNPAVNK